MPRYLIALLPCLLFLYTGCTGQTAESADVGVEDISATAFAEKMAEPDVVVLDVRTPGETELGMIPGAREIDYRAPDFAERLAELDLNKTYLVYCQSGGRSGEAADQLVRLGAEKVYNLEGGYRAWITAKQQQAE